MTMHPLCRPYRLAAYLLVFFAAAHTISGPPSNGAAADAVLASMKNTDLPFRGSDSTFHGFHMCFGLMVSVHLVMSGAIAWIRGAPGVTKNPAVKVGIRPIAWTLFVGQRFTMVLSWMYSFTAPGVISTLVVLLLGWEVLTK